MEKYPKVGCKRGYFVDTASTQLPRGRVGLFYGFTDESGTPDRTMSAKLVGGAESITELRQLYPEAFTGRADRCPACGGLNPGDITHTRC